MGNFTRIGRRTAIQLGAGALLLGVPAPAHAAPSELVSLWLALAGGPEPDAAGVERHFRACHPTQLDALLEAWGSRPRRGAGLEEWIRAHLWSDASLRSTCKDLVLTIWFGVPYRDGKAAAPSGAPGELEERAALWSAGRFWNVIGTHAPGGADLDYGEWAKPPRGS